MKAPIIMFSICRTPLLAVLSCSGRIYSITANAISAKPSRTNAMNFSCSFSAVIVYSISLVQSHRRLHTLESFQQRGQLRVIPNCTKNCTNQANLLLYPLPIAAEQFLLKPRRFLITVLTAFPNSGLSILPQRLEPIIQVCAVALQLTYARVLFFPDRLLFINRLLPPWTSRFDQQSYNGNHRAALQNIVYIKRADTGYHHYAGYLSIAGGRASRILISALFHSNSFR